MTKPTQRRRLPRTNSAGLPGYGYLDPAPWERCVATLSLSDGSLARCGRRHRAGSRSEKRHIDNLEPAPPPIPAAPEKLPGGYSAFVPRQELIDGLYEHATGHNRFGELASRLERGKR